MKLNDLALVVSQQNQQPDGQWLAACIELLSSSEGIQLLQAYPALLGDLRVNFWKFLETHPARSWLSQGNLSLEQSLLASLGNRLLGKVLPPVPRAGDLQDQVRLALEERSSKIWLEKCQSDQVIHLMELLTPEPGHPLRLTLLRETWGALDQVSHRLAAQATDPELMRHFSDLQMPGNPFLEQAREMPAIAAGESPSHLLVLLNQCQEILAKIRRRAHRLGTSTQLTYALVAAQQSIERLRLLLKLAQGSLEPQAQAEFYLELARAEERRFSLRDVGSQHFQVLLWRATHHAGQTGHHYIAETSTQLRKLFMAAAGAGLVVGILALLKLQIAGLHLPLFVQAFFFSLNYALGFVLIHLCGFTIATKQPAMTAAALANSLSEDWKSPGSTDLQAVADKCWKTLKSQTAAIFGNVLLALPMALVLSLLWHYQWGAPVASAQKLSHLLHELHPWQSLAVFHAALAGVGLFAVGLLSGYVDNLCAYYAVPERLAHSPMVRRWFGSRSQAMARYAESETGALVGNVALGFYLGSLSALGMVIGLPLDIRHVSFASGNLGLILSQGLPPLHDLMMCLLGIALIGMANLVTSFGLALWLAMRARGLGYAALLHLLREMAKKFQNGLAQPETRRTVSA